MASMASQRTFNRYQKHKPNLIKEVSSHVRNAAPPEKIKCSRCNVVKGPYSFSKNKLGVLASQMRAVPGMDAAKVAHVPCSACTGGQVVELTCYMCDKSKGLDGFPKTARRTPDHALCWKCSKEKEQYEPRAAMEDDDDSGHDDSGSSDDSDDDYTSMCKSVGGVSLGRDGSVATYRTGFSSSSAGGVTVPASTTPTTHSAAAGDSAHLSAGEKWAKVRNAERPSSKLHGDPEDSPHISDDDSEEESEEETLFSL